MKINFTGCYTCAAGQIVNLIIESFKVLVGACGGGGGAITGGTTTTTNNPGGSGGSGSGGTISTTYSGVGNAGVSQVGSSAQTSSACGSSGCKEDSQCECGKCENNGCVADPAKDGNSCSDDGNICTKDVCSNGTCSHPLKSLEDRKLVNQNTDPLSLSCSQRVEKPLPYMPSYNGCGTERSPLDFYQDWAWLSDVEKEEITEICNKHDVGYATCNTSKAGVDDTFFKSLNRICPSTTDPRMCYGGVASVILGFSLPSRYKTETENAFAAGQREGCQCCSLN